MVLHRDIYWLGRQWCVTGYGIQAVAPKYEMAFDIPAADIWNDDVAARAQQQPWFDADDFAQAVSFARSRAKLDPTLFLPPPTDER